MITISSPPYRAAMSVLRMAFLIDSPSTARARSPA
jgi:hypothetical protein